VDEIREGGTLRGQTSGQLLPAAVGGARNNLEGLSGGEGEASVALVRRLSAVSHIGRANREAVVDLRDRTAINLCKIKFNKHYYLNENLIFGRTLALGDVGNGPFSSRQTLGDEFVVAGGELVSSGTGEGDNGAKGCVSAGRLGALAGLQRGTVGRVGGLPTGGRMQRVAHKAHQHGAAVGGEGDAWTAASAEALARVKTQTACRRAIINLLK